jgi:ribonuclease HI
MRKFRRYHLSPLYQVAEALKDIEMEEMETINPVTLAPWEKRVETVVEMEITRQPDTNRAAYIAVSSSARNGVVGFGAAIKTRKHVGDAPTVETLSVTLGPRTEQNPYVGELAAMAHAFGQLHRRKYHGITLLTRNKAAVLTLRNPREQSGQEHVCSIYQSMAELKRKCDKITVTWLPSGEDDELWTCAKEKAKEATRQDKEP